MKTQLKLLVVLLLISPIAALSQKGGPAKKATPQGGNVAQKSSGNCFHEWHSLIRERGASTVTDGVQDVVIGLWNSATNSSKCYLGKVEVSGGKLKRPILIQKEDGSFEPFSTLGKGLEPAFAKAMTEDQLTSITDGMSAYFQLSEIEGGQIFFYTFVNPKPKGLKEAPSAKSLVKN